LTYCAALSVDRGLVFASDSRTHAGVDQVSTYSKMHTFLGDGERMLTVLTAGNLATTQAVVRQLRRDLDAGTSASLKSLAHLDQAAEYIGKLSLEQQRKHRDQEDKLDIGASFILGGEIRGQPAQIYLIYPEGNYIRASRRVPFLQIGESKYGKPILDRIVEPGLALETAARCALVSMDSTMRSNITVGPPIELLIYDSGSYSAGRRIVLDEDNDYLRQLRVAWQENLKTAFVGLPALPAMPAPVRLVDAPGDQ
jgi:putative proteasome-type protease